MKQIEKLTFQKILYLALENTGSSALLAQKLDVRVATVNSWLKGNAYPRAICLLRLAELARYRQDPISVLGDRGTLKSKNPFGSER